MATLEPLMQRNFLEYASYVIVDRAIPDIRDGCKPVQRRILQTLIEMEDGKFHKVANVIGETMKLHPHGDVSIGDALVVLANKDYFIERQGNFGNIITGHSAAAPRYIECRLTELAKETLFNKSLTQFQPSYDGRKDEAVFLPAKLPVLLMLGTEGIAVGMSTRILPHNLPELLESQIKILEYEPVVLFPDFPTGGIVDVSEYDEGRGKIRVRALIEADGDKRVVIREIPYGTTTESVIASIESAAQKGKVKVASIYDFTTDSVEIEVQLPRGVHADEVIPQLYAYTECEVSISSNMVIIKDRHPVEMSANEVLRYLTDRLRDQICAELELALKDLRDQEHWLTLEQIFIEKRVYKRIEEARTEEMVMFEVHEGMKEYRKELKRTLTDDDVKRLLEIRIRRISKYDINKNRKQLRDVADAIDEVNARLGALTQTTIQYLQGLLAKYGASYPRRSRIEKFDQVDKKAVAQANIKVAYDPETGFFGSDVKGAEYQMTLSEYDRVLIVTDDGAFRIIGPEAKVLISGKVLYLCLFDVDKGKVFTVVYRDNDRIAFAKKVHIHKFIRDKEYELIKGKEGKIDFLIPGETLDALKLSFVPKKRQRVSELEFELASLELTGVTARGTRLAPKPIARIKQISRALPAGGAPEPMMPQKRDSIPPRRSVAPPPPSAEPELPKPAAEPAKKPAPPDDDGPKQRKLF